jgi:GH15 family glucan-1,4-alpha-glucosidase
MLNIFLKHLKNLQLSNNLFLASKRNTNYNKIWIRDNLYISLAFEAIEDNFTTQQIFHSLLDIMLKFEWKIDYAINEKPTEDYQFIHPLYTKNMEEIKESWGWKQNDAIGGLLFHIGMLNDKCNIIRNEKDMNIIKKLAHYLYSIKYWEDEDNGMWEENKEIHASSVGACTAGLCSIRNIIHVPDSLIKKGEEALNNLLPNESKTKNTDLSLLSLIYPYNIVNNTQTQEILKNIEENLIRNKGTIRYIGDNYYKENTEASWTMGFPWLAIIYKLMKNEEKYIHYLKKTFEVINDNGEMTELFINDETPNENTPLGWSQALLINALLI